MAEIDVLNDGFT